ncbi:MAG: tRNA (N6-threonylcarbamoyladenosine(37)-N6)-methyltransferase TrmO [Prevotella sp.]|nr:tRNA (N6-threonylcarbamoyladenosine(37)-N6)-methyltransferase TrmO [Prevotella sp.]
MDIQPIAHFHSPLTSKFGIPRQSGLAESLEGHIIFEPSFRRAEAVRGLEGFDYIWLIWQFSANPDSRPSPLTVRPPRLGGNRRVGVFASRSPFRPNSLGLSCVRLDRVETDDRLGPILHVLGADLMDGTPIFDVKPYVPYADSHPDVRCGFVGEQQWDTLQVVMPEAMADVFTSAEQEALRSVLAQDPRPQYHADDSRVYGMPFSGHDIRFRVSQGVLTVVEVK